MKLVIKVDKNLNRAYIPKELLEEIGSGEWGCLSNARAGLFFPNGSDLRDVLKSLDIIRDDISHRIEIEENEGKKRPRRGR